MDFPCFFQCFPLNRPIFSASRDPHGLPGRCESTVAFGHPSAGATENSRRDWLWMKLIDVPNSHCSFFLRGLKLPLQQVNDGRWYTSHRPKPIFTKRTLLMMGGANCKAILWRIYSMIWWNGVSKEVYPKLWTVRKTDEMVYPCAPCFWTSPYFCNPGWMVIH